jgi:SPRY domain
LFGGDALSSRWTEIVINSSGNINIHSTNTSVVMDLITTQVFRDPSAWYHVLLSIDTTQATSTNRVILYINGQQVTSFSTSTYPAQNTSLAGVNQTVLQSIGKAIVKAGNLDGYLTEINFVDGQQLTPSSFGQTNSVTGVWQPIKYGGTYGTNGFYLNFSDNSNNTAATIGKDYSGNGNNWTPNNISVTAGTTYDSMLDVPTPYTDGGNGRGNYCVLNPLITPATTTIVNGNLGLSGYTAFSSETGTIGVSSGKWYFEFVAQLNSISGITGTPNGSFYPGQAANAYAWDSFGPNKYNNNTATSYGSATSAGDIVGVAFDLDSGSITFYKNNVSQGTAYTFTPSGTYFPVVRNGSATNTAVNFGQQPFSYTPPSGFVALNTQNLPTPTISNGANYMAATLWTGNGTSQTINNSVNGISFAPDLVWAKNRTSAYSNVLIDTIRGATNYIVSNATAAEATNAQVYSAFTSTGFSVGNDLTLNASSSSVVGWQWKAGGTSSSNTSGSITSTVSAGATQGFSVVTYTGTGANATVGHGLGVAPKMVIVKMRNAVASWIVWQTALAGTEYIVLESTAAKATLAAMWNSTTPTSSVFSIGTNANTNGNTNTYVAYCFSEVAGYSKFGSYTGNGSTDGTFSYCGFRPRFVMVKRTDATGNWFMYDTSRDTYNVAIQELYANLSNAEAAGTTDLDILSNGFKMRATSAGINANAGTYIFAAFAENPFKNSLAR